MIQAAAFHASRHVAESQLEPVERACAFCGAETRRVVHRLQSDPEVLLLQCDRCHASTASRRPTDQALAELYSTYYNDKAPDAPRVTFNYVERFGDHLARAWLHSRKHQPRVRILDFGGGDGGVAIATARTLLGARVESAEITLVDFHEKPADPGDPRITIRRFAELEEAGGGYDLVVASAVIEHLPRPRPVLDALLAALGPGGLFYARTPWILPIMRTTGRLGLRWDFTYPAHLHDLGQDFWEHHFANLPGFTLQRSQPSLVETTLDQFLVRTLAAHLLKAPWRLFGRHWPWVGGWEVFVRRNPAPGA
jgi:SAM-dependent methyltransferase